MLKLIDYLMPHRCVDCLKITGAEMSLCAECWNNYVFIEEPWCDVCGRPFEIEIDSLCLSCIKKHPPYDRSRSIFKFNDKSRLLIHSFKYHDKTYLAKFFANLLFSKYKSFIDEADVITCVPMHYLKRLFRMYNQSHLIAKEVANLSKKEFAYSALRKTRYTKSQTFLSKTARKENLKNSFICSNPDKIFGKKVILIDDVETTGETVKLCSSILKKAGAKSVVVLSVVKNYR